MKLTIKTPRRAAAGGRLAASRVSGVPLWSGVPLYCSGVLMLN